MRDGSQTSSSENEHGAPLCAGRLREPAACAAMGGMVGRAGFGGFSPCHAFTLQMKDAAAVGRGKPWESLKGSFAKAGMDTPASATLEGAPGDVLRAATSACLCAQGEPVFLHLRHGVISRTWERVRSGRAWIEGALLAQPVAAALHAAAV